MTPNTVPDEDLLPALPLASWNDTLATLHMWTQVVGKVRLKLCPLVNHFLECPLLLDRAGNDNFGDAIPSGNDRSTI